MTPGAFHTTILKMGLLSFSCPRSKPFVIFMNSPVLRVCLPIWYESRFSVWQSLRRLNWSRFLYRRKGAGGVSAGSVSPQIALLHLHNATNVPRSVVRSPSHEQQSGEELSDSNPSGWVTCQRALPHSLRINQLNSWTIFFLQVIEHRWFCIYMTKLFVIVVSYS